jgi:hypothetical protein
VEESLLKEHKVKDETEKKSKNSQASVQKEPQKKSEIPQAIINELIQIANDNEGKIKNEDFIDFLKSKNLENLKSEILSVMESQNIDLKIKDAPTVLKPERLKIYNEFLVDFKKELKAIMRRAKKNFGMIESTYIYKLFDNDDIFKKNIKFLRHYLKENEVKIIKVPKTRREKVSDEKSEIVGDPVRQY